MECAMSIYSCKKYTNFEDGLVALFWKKRCYKVWMDRGQITLKLDASNYAKVVRKLRSFDSWYFLKGFP